VFGIIMVFLILAAQYEKVDVAAGGAAGGAVRAGRRAADDLGRGLENDVYFQVGLVTLIGLAAKNAILITEFAVMNVRAGMSARTPPWRRRACASGRS
jgi:multidrug efflux pump subunit AcrB